MAFEVFDDVAFYYLCTSLLTMFMVPFTIFKVWGIIDILKKKDSKSDDIDVSKFGKMKKITVKEPWTKTYLTTTNFLFVCGWVLIIFMLVKLPTYEGAELLDFQPYSILEIEETDDDNIIKKAYRKMSLKYHPDKNPDDEDAELKFIEVSKAYKALTDVATKENFQKYGNADGYQGTSVTIGLPSFLTEKSNELKVLVMYFIFMIVIPPMLVWMWWQKARDFHTTGALNDTVKIYFSYVTEHMSARTLIEMLAASKEYLPIAETRPDQKEIDAEVKKLYILFKPAPKNSKPNPLEMKLSKGFEKVKYIQITSVLLHAYLMREPIAPCLRPLLAIILKDAHRLLAVLFDVCIAKKFYKVSIAALELMQLLSQAMWFQESPLLQLPFISHKDVQVAVRKEMGELEEFKRATREKRSGVLKNISNSQWDDIEKVLSKLPDMEVAQTTELEDEDDVEIFEDDMVTVVITMKRMENVKEGDDTEVGALVKLGDQLKMSRKVHLSTDKGAEGIIDNIKIMPDETEDEIKERQVMDLGVLDEKELDKIMEDEDEKERRLLEDLPTGKKKKEDRLELGKPAHCPFFPFEKYEKWCLLLWQKDRKGTRLLRIQKVPAFQDESRVEVKMRMGEKGVFNYEVQARCDSYVGCDVACSFKITVRKLTSEEKTRRETNLELSKDYGLDEEEEEEEEEEGVWYYMGFSSFWEMILNLVVLAALGFVGYNFLKTRGYWDKYFQPPLDLVMETTAPVTNAISNVVTPVTVVLTPVCSAVGSAWESFSAWVVPAEELSPNYKRNRNEGFEHEDL